MFALNRKELVLSDGKQSTQLRKITQGNCGLIYRGVLGDRQLAVKILDNVLEEYNHGIILNIASNRALFSHNAFVPLVHIQQDGDWYIMEYFPSTDMARQKRESRGAICDSTKKRAITVYAEMLNHLHDNGTLFVDNKWSSLLLGEHDMMVCDYDCACPLDRIAGSIFNCLS